MDWHCCHGIGVGVGSGSIGKLGQVTLHCQPDTLKQTTIQIKRINIQAKPSGQAGKSQRAKKDERRSAILHLPD